MRVAALVALAAFAVYIGSFRTIVSTDAVTNVLLSYSVVRDGDATLDEFQPDSERLSFWSYEVRGHRYAWYLPGAAYWAAPFTLAGTVVGIVPPQTASVTIVGKLAAAAAAALSVYAVVLLAARAAGRRNAVVVGALYAFGTATWPMSAGALWQHGPAQLAVAVGLLWLVRGGLWGVRSGLAFGLATVVRPMTVFLTLAAGASLLPRLPVVGRFVLWGLGPLVLLASYGYLTFGQLLPPFFEPFATGSALVGIAGNLVSPSRGLLVFSPFLAIAIGELVVRAGEPGRLARLLRWQLAGAVAMLVFDSFYVEWWGGYGYGNRYLAELLPLLSLGLALWLRRHGRGRRVLVPLGAWSIALAAIGALLYDWVRWPWERQGPPLGELVWSWGDPQWLDALGRAGARLDVVTAMSFAIAIAAGAFLVRVYRTV